MRTNWKEKPWFILVQNAITKWQMLIIFTNTSSNVLKNFCQIKVEVAENPPHRKKLPAVKKIPSPRKVDTMVQVVPASMIRREQPTDPNMVKIIFGPAQ